MINGGEVTKEKDALLVKIEAGVATLVINRPGKRNILNPEIFARIGEVLRAISQDGQTKVAILRGAGEQAFSAGFEISRLHVSDDSVTDNPLEEVMLAIESCPVPVIAMIYG